MTSHINKKCLKPPTRGKSQGFPVDFPLNQSIGPGLRTVQKQMLMVEGLPSGYVKIAFENGHL